MLEAIGVASQTGWGQMVAFGTISVGVGHVLAGRIGKGIGVLESAIAAYDARGEIVYATFYKIALAKLLEMLTSRAKPPLSVILRNFGMVLRVKFFGVRRIEALLEQTGRAPHLHEPAPPAHASTCTLASCTSSRRNPISHGNFSRKRGRRPASRRDALGGQDRRCSR